MLNNDNTNNTTTKGIRYAGFGTRLLAYLIDNVIIFFALLLIRLATFIASLIGLDFLSTEVLFNHTISDIILYVCRSAYFVLLTYFTSATIGKHILRIRVISSKEKKFSFVDILYRETIGRYLSALILHIGYLLILINQDKAAMHDMLCDTYVVYKTDNKSSNNEQVNANNKSTDHVFIDEYICPTKKVVTPADEMPEPSTEPNVESEDTNISPEYNKFIPREIE